MAYNDLVTDVASFTTQASAASTDLAGIVSGADVLATQFDSLSIALNELTGGQYTVLKDTAAARPVTPSTGQLFFASDTKALSLYGGSWGVVSPTGIISPYGGSTAPEGWFLCDGAEYSQSTYAALYAVLSTSYNTGSETAGYFRVPDLRGRVAVGKGTHADVDALTDNDGITPANVANRSPKHSHSLSGSVTDAGAIATGGHSVDHTHGFTDDTLTATSQGSQLASGSFYARFSFAGSSSGDNTGGASTDHSHTLPAHGHANTFAVGVGSGTANTMPYLVTNYIIKV